MFKKSAIALAIAAASTLSVNVMAAEESAAGDQYVEKVNEFIADSALSLVTVIDTRSRTRSNGGTTGDEVFSRLDYSAYNLILDFNSGYHDDWLGFDMGGYFSGDLYNNSMTNGGTGEYLCNEVSSCNNLDWGAGEGGMKVYKAALKFKMSENFGARVGMLQSGGNGTIGNVWSFVPGTYRGGDLTAKLGDFNLAYSAFDSHTAPWLISEDDYAPALWSDTSWSLLHSVGLNGNITDSLFMQVGLGQATNVVYAKDIDWGTGVVNTYKDPVDTTSYKAYLKYTINDTFSIAGDFYGTNDDAVYDGMGFLAGLSLAANFGSISWNSEVRHANSSNGQDVNARSIYTYGMNNGTFSQYWDGLSDWNKSGETSWYNRISYNQGNGWNYYAGVGFGTGVEDGATGDWDYTSEYAVNATISYSLQSGPLKGATMRLHGTMLERNERDGAGNADETDVRFQVIVPYNFI